MENTERIVAESLLNRLFPICRSITGKGFEETIAILNEGFQYQIKREPSGGKVFDWNVPPVWTIRDAWVKNSKGEKIIDFQLSNLSVVSFSVPIHKVVDASELLAKLHYLEGRSDWVPYRTSYYREDWGFCCPHSLITSEKFTEPFEICIDSDLNSQGNLVWSETFHQGSSNQEILISTYACHPSLANDNLSGLVTAKLFFDYIKQFKTKYSYRFIVIPETIGALCFLKNHPSPERIVAGFVVTCTAGPGNFGIKMAFDENHWINDFSISALKKSGNPYKVYPFVPDGSDERQYASPGFRIPTVSLTSDKYYEYPEYHTSADNLDFVSIDRLLEVLAIHKNVFHEIESSFIPVRTSSMGEYQLGKRNLFPNIGGSNYQGARAPDSYEVASESRIEAFSWIMHLADGLRSIEHITAKSQLPTNVVLESIEIFKREGLLVCLSDFS